MAAIIRRVLGIDTTLTPGGRGEFTVWLDGRKVIEKGHHDDFPDEATVRSAIGRP